MPESRSARIATSTSSSRSLSFASRCWRWVAGYSDVGVLGAPEEVFHLRLNELEAVDDPANLTESGKDELRDAVRTRSARRERADRSAPH